MTKILDPESRRAELLRRRLHGTVSAPRVDRIGRVPRDTPLPLSFAQRRMWILDQMRPGGAEYLTMIPLRVRGRLDTAALRTALTGLVERHEVLRTRYPVVDGQPVQVIDAAYPVAPAELDLRRFGQEERDRHLTELMTVARQLVDLSAGQVFRAQLVRLAEEQHALLLTTHHIATDQWSEDIVVRELTTRYAAAVTGASAPLAPLPAQYADFAVWQRNRMTTALAGEQLNYWREQLAGLAPLDLPTDRPRPAVWDASGAVVAFTIPAATARKLLRLAREHRATPFMVLLAAFKVLIGRYSGQSDVAIGTPVAGRDRPEVQQIVGLFLNTLVLRTELAPDPSFVELLEQVRETALDGFANQDLPFEHLVDESAPQRDPSRNPLFSTMFLWQEPAASGCDIDGLTIERIPVTDVVAKLDLTLAVAPRPDGSLAGSVTYATAIFNRDTIERFAGNLIHLMAEAAAAPRSPISRLALPTESTGWNDTGVAYPPATLPGLFEAQVSRTPDAIAVRFEDRDVSYAELNARANQLAHHLRELGVGPESIVGVRLPRGVELVTALLAVLKAGGAYLPLDPDYPRDRINHMLADSGTHLVISDQFPIPPDLPTGNPGVDISPRHPAYVIYTSGSTGRPNGVVIEHAAIANRLRWMRQEYELNATDRVLQKTPYSFDVSVWELFLPLITGATMVLARPGGHRDPTYLVDLIATEQVTTVHFVPSMLRAFLASPFDHAMPSIRRMICSGEALTADLVADVHSRIGCELHNLYGPTEAAVDVTAARCAPGELVTIGRPIANTQTYILDATMRTVPVDVPGELMLGGVQLARGYVNQSALTAERFIPNPFTPGARLYRTGDRARYRPDGSIEFLGRQDRQVKIRGQRVELGEIETVLNGHPEVAAATITVHEGRIIAYVVAEDIAALPAFLRERLPSSMLPGRWVQLAELPLTPSGKIDYAALPQPDDRQDSDGYVAPRTAMERVVAGAMEAAIGVDEVAVHDSFFQLGGDSMRAIRVVGMLRAGGVEVAVHDLFIHQTPAELAVLVAGQAPPAVADEVLVDRFGLISNVDRERLPAGLVDAYPMAQTQAGMVYEMFAADRPVYQNVSCYRLRDDMSFSLPLLREAIRLLVERHEILRTSFDLHTYSQPMQLVHPFAVLPVEFDDLRGMPEPTQRSTVDTFLAGQRTKRFDIARPPLLRYHVHQVGDNDWCLTHTECHAILDGWSHTSLVAELISTYRALREGTPAESAPPPRVRYADLVAAEQKSLTGAADRAFWLAKIRDYDRLDLPAGWGSDEPDEAPEIIIQVPFDDLEPGLRRLAVAAGASMKSVLHAAHLKSLSIITGRRRFLTGLVCHGRPELPHGDEVLGMYLNTVPFGADVTASTWRVLVESVFAGEARLWPHRRYPMPVMQRDWGHSAPLVEIAFTCLDFHVLDSTSGIDLIDDFSPNELALSVATFPGLIHVAGRPSRIGRPQLEMLSRTYRHVLEAMAADPDGDARHLTLAPADRDHVLLKWNQTTKKFPTDRFVHQLVESQALSTPDAIALRSGDQTVSYASLEHQANRLAHRLRTLGVGPDTVVGLYLSRSPDLFVALLAVLKAGGAFLYLDPTDPIERVRYVQNDAGAAVVLTTSDHRPHLSATVEFIDQIGTDLPTTPPIVPLDQDNLAYVIYTSGSTGRPKGVAIPHSGALNLRHAQREPLDIHPTDRVLQFASPSFDASVLEVLMALTNGAELVLPPPGTDPSDLRQQAATVTHMLVPPAMLSRLSPSAFPHLRVVISGGEACHRSQAIRWAKHATFINAYGPTENSVCATQTTIPRTPVDQAPSIGLPIANIQAYVLDEDLLPVPAGARGELCVGGAGLARGYVNHPDLTADRFIPNPYSDRPGARLYRTGDLVSRNHDGTLQYRGRTDHQVKVRGFRIEPGEVEHTLGMHPDVAGTVVTVHRAGTDDATLVAYVKATSGTHPTAAVLREHLHNRLPTQMVPTHWLTVEEFPLTTTGKVDRAALPAPQDHLTEFDAEYQPPRTELEHTIAAAWREALRVPRVGVHDDFFDLGGHSMAMIRIISTLRENHGLELTFRSFLEQHTVAELSGAIEKTTRTRSLLWLRRNGTRTPLVCVHPGGGSAHWFQRFLPHLHPEQPLAAFEWASEHDENVTIPPFEEMVERHHAELCEQQPHGPYQLFSWCGGSAIAAELGTRLLAEGEDVTLMLLDPVLDAHTRPNFYEQIRKVHRLEELVNQVARGGPAADDPAIRQEIIDLYWQVANDVDEEVGMDLPERGVGSAWPRTVRIWRESMDAIIEYPNLPYAGRLHLIVTDALAGGDHIVVSGQTFDDYVSRWRELAMGGVDVHRVPGDHTGVMKPPHVSHLVSVITQLIAGPGGT